MTKDDLIASLPARLRQFKIAGPSNSLEDANKLAAYFSAAYQEVVAYNETLALAKREFITERMIGLLLTRMLRTEFGNKAFEFVRRHDGLRLVTEIFNFTDVDLTMSTGDFSEQVLLNPVRAFIAKCGQVKKFCRLPEVGGVDMKGFAECWLHCFSVRFVKAYDISTNSCPCRLDAWVE